MKKIILIITATIMLYTIALAQDKSESQLQALIAKLDSAGTTKEYQHLANDFLRIGESQQTQWLPYYYAALCNAKIGWTKQNDPDNIEPFANKAEEEITKSMSLIDTAKQKNELSEVYCVLSMINRARVFINPQTYGQKYGPVASRYTRLAAGISPGNPRALYLQGWEKFETPKLWGGDKKQAKELLLSAKQALEQNTSNGTEPHWGKTEIRDLLAKF